MNATEIESDTTFVQAAVPLLKEYGEKLKELAAGAIATFPVTYPQATVDSIRDELIDRFKFLKPPIEELVHQSSAVLNEGSLRGLAKVELWLRLAELEHNLNTASQRIDLIKPKKQPGVKP